MMIVTQWFKYPQLGYYKPLTKTNLGFKKICLFDSTDFLCVQYQENLHVIPKFTTKKGRNCITLENYYHPVTY